MNAGLGPIRGSIRAKVRGAIKEAIRAAAHVPINASIHSGPVNVLTNAPVVHGQVHGPIKVLINGAK